MLSDGERSQLCKRLKERNVPYVIHSGYSHLNGAYGDAVHVPKPANPDVLVTTVLGYRNVGVPLFISICTLSFLAHLRPRRNR